MRAFVAVFGVLQNGKWVLCNFGKEISEGFWQFLIVCCGCSPCGGVLGHDVAQRIKCSNIFVLVRTQILNLPTRSALYVNALVA